MKTVKTIDLDKLRHDAEDNFRSGFYCCEALMSAFIDDFELDVPREVIRMSSGMAVGVGKSGCVCGALNGGIMALGMLFGRDEPQCLRYIGKFFPSWAAFTFPFVISAIASKQLMACAAKLESSLPWLSPIVAGQTVIAAVLVVYVLVRYLMFVFAKPAAQSAVATK